MASQLPSIRTLSKLAIGGVQVLLGSGQTVLGGPSKTCSNPQLSCQNTTAVADLCCFNAPGGQLLQTQFWDTAPVTGPVDSWTLHGLWPDHCDGTYDANCDASRAYTNISSIISSFGKTDLLSYMQTYWKDYQGDDETFWEHEWAKHGTCISTLEPDCYTNHKPTEEVVDYFQKAVDLFKALPSYTWLAAAGITPSTTKTYTTAAIQAAITAKRPGVSVTLGCSSSALNEIWYHYDVRGSVQTGEFVAANPDGTKSTCPSTGIKYLPKTGGATGTSPSTSAPTGTTAPGTPFTGKGYLNVNVGSTQTGCVISAGTWYTSGTCATFTAATSGSGFTLTSSKGKCGVVSGALVCGSSVTTATAFTAVSGKLAAGGNAVWSADAVASGSTQQTVYAGSGHSSQISIVWQSA
ncbi:ribonuclease M [Melanomma pulvis-pyrius CBS 109.77]|uniref:Ribonuclease T2-like n=1 Tax=Melanomma pulvis-pyrius CBS 109.77 TaxID=1314802 RepID=A0A6A6XQK8_9PLEO|nr:ribonuclease M [Melanomma pulvis-pyrius CBS 109.77]